MSTLPGVERFQARDGTSLLTICCGANDELTALPILGPEQVPAGALVFIPMSVPVAEKIIHRWRHLPFDFRFVASNRPI